MDTNICIYFIKGKFALDRKFGKINPENCFISEITLAELKFGVENSQRVAHNKKALDIFLSGIKILPIFHSIDFYAKEKARLRQSGITVDDFDLLIGATAVTNGLVMVTNNFEHFKYIKGIILEDWTKQ
ncbi:MAG: type II toxin-antitoxin system VapC family toxin [Bacteroidia bacterium]|nr:type II toxin-antitoxin system VapC family toxin [Bacteroidia bacterium]